MIRNIFVLIALCAVAAESTAFLVHRSRRSAATCGRPRSEQGMIVRGQSFTRGSFPWIVALMHTESTPPEFFCAGTLISETFVISAAHCILQKHTTEKLLPRDILAIFGAHDLSNLFEAGRFQLSPKKIRLHDDWNPMTAEYDADLSLLEFEDSIPLNRFVQPICLWDSENDPAVTEGVVVGWGKSEDETKEHENIPKLVKALIQTNEDCFFTEGQKHHLDVSSRRTFCAGLRNGSGICQGDSGGGLFIKVNGVHFLKGIVSSSPVNSDGGCDVSINAIYTNVLKFKEWIIDTASVARKVFCTYTTVWDKKACGINQTIDGENVIIGSPKNTSIESFDANRNKQLKFLPKGTGEKFPNLKTFWAHSCGLTVVRDFYFKNMGRLQTLFLRYNQIKTIEPKAFDDLVSLSTLDLHDNQIETLDEKLFVNLINLEWIALMNNRIKFLSPTTFNIPGNEKLNFVGLSGNVCIYEGYGPHAFPLNELESDLREHCSQRRDFSQ